MPKISVIVPVYKVEAFLGRCVDSILSQTFSDFTLVLVDDGSPDSCGAMCDEYALRDNRIHVIHQKNGGLSAARNAGIDWVLANTDCQWLAFVDSDDWVHPQFLRLLLSAVEETDSLIGACGFFRTENGPFPAEQDMTIRCMSADDYYCGAAHDGLTAVAWNKLYHRSLFADLRYPVGKLHEDEFTTYRAVYQTQRVGVTPAKLYAYYQNPQGIMGSAWNPRRMHVLEAFEQQILFARETKNDRLLRKASEAYIFSICSHLDQSERAYHGMLRKKLRQALALGRECGSFPLEKNTLWAYETAYPMKPLWWLISKLEKKHE